MGESDVDHPSRKVIKINYTGLRFSTRSTVSRACHR